MTDDAMPGPARIPRVVVLASGTGTTAAALLRAAADPAWGARIVAVGSDRPAAPVLELAREAGVPTVVVDPAEHPDRLAWDVALTRAVEVFDPDLVVLAGFMRLVGQPFLASFGGRTVNTHPALLPSFPGAHGVRDALAHGVKVSGATVMLVDAGIDTGPVLAQAVVPVLDDDDEAALHHRIQDVERPLLVDVVGRMVRDGWTVNGRKATLQ